MTGLATTFEVLSSTKNEAAVNALVPALESVYPNVQEGSLRAILDRRSVVGGREIIRRLHTVNERWRTILQERRGRLSKVLREGIVGSDEQMCANSCQAIISFREYDLMGPLIKAVEDPTHSQSQLMCQTLTALCDLLYEEAMGPRDYAERRDPQLVRRNVVTLLEQSVGRFGQHKRVETIEAFLTLAGRKNAALRHMLGDLHHAAYLSLVDVISNSRLAGVMRLLLSFLDDDRPPLATLNIIGRRKDLVFVRELLAKTGPAPSEQTEANLKRIETIAWASPSVGVLSKLDDEGQHCAVQLVLASGIARLKAFKTVKYLLQQGRPGGRRAAAARLAEFQGSEANALAQRALDDDDPEVQANVLRQLRQRGMQGALATLIAKLESPHEAVQQAARESLPEFRFERYLAAFESLDEQAQRSTGALVKRVDPETQPRLVEELGSLMRTRRLRGLAVVMAMQAADDFEPQLIELLEDEDHMVRHDAVRALGQCVTSTARDALVKAAGDTSPAVREAAESALAALPASQTTANQRDDAAEEGANDAT